MLFPLTPQANRHITTQYVINKFFTDETINQIFKNLSEDKWEDALVTRSADENADKNFLSKDRICQKQILNYEQIPLYNIANAVRQANDEYWKFDISNINYNIDAPAIYRYNVNGLFDWHIDLSTNLSTRKLSFTIQLSDPKDYEGGELQFFDGKETYINKNLKEKGSIIIFPSFVWHRILPITKGTRYSLVGWIHGNSFK